MLPTKEASLFRQVVKFYETKQYKKALKVRGVPACTGTQPHQCMGTNWDALQLDQWTVVAVHGPTELGVAYSAVSGRRRTRC